MTFLSEYHQRIINEYQSNTSKVRKLQSDAIKQLLPDIVDQLGSGSEEDENELWERGRIYLEDGGAIFRHLRKCKFEHGPALSALRFTIEWRIKSRVDMVDTFPTSQSDEEDIHFYLRSPLMFYHPNLEDKWGRPCAVINIKEVKRYPESSLEAIKEYIAFQWELGRRYLTEKNALQMVLIVDLGGAGMSNMEVELLPFFLDLLRSHFPGMVGAIYILNYGWMYAGVWQVMKKLLPTSVLARILFPSKEELENFFDKDHLLEEHGGSFNYTFIAQSSVVLQKHGVPIYTKSEEPSPLRIPSHHSISAISESSPALLSRLPTPSTSPKRGRSLGWLNMTRLTSGFVGSGPSKASGSRGKQGSSSTSSSTSDIASNPDSDEYTDSESDSDVTIRNEESALQSNQQSPGMSFVNLHPSQTSISKMSSRASSPQRRRKIETYTSMGTSLDRENGAAGRITWKKELGRYHASNPFFGYRSEEGRRRKRDLIRTLTYLAALRFLSFHRRVTGMISLGWSAVGSLAERKRTKRRWNWLLGVILLMAFRNAGFEDLWASMSDGLVRIVREQGLI